MKTYTITDVELDQINRLLTETRDSHGAMLRPPYEVWREAFAVVIKVAMRERVKLSSGISAAGLALIDEEIAQAHASKGFTCDSCGGKFDVKDCHILYGAGNPDHVKGNYKLCKTCNDSGDWATREVR